MQHVLKTLEIKAEGQQLLLAQWISYIRKLLNTKDVTYQYLVDNSRSKLFVTYTEQIIIFQNRNQEIPIKISTSNDSDIVDKPLKRNGIAYNTYIGKKTQNTPLVHTTIYSMTYKEDNALEFPLKNSQQQLGR